MIHSETGRAAVYLSTLGCRLNEAELVSWGTAFEAQGHRLVSAAQDANLIVLNTCAVTAEAARKSRKHAAVLHRKNPSARLVVTGCMAELDPKKAAELAGVDLVLGNLAKDQLVAKVLSAIELHQMPALAQEPTGHHVYAEGRDETPSDTGALVQLGKRAMPRTRAFIKVQDGCRNHCSYCVVTIARGEERSRGIDELIREIDGLADKGYREAVLTGVHLGGYGHDLGTDLSTLVLAVLERSKIERVRLSSLEPWDLPDNFGDLWQHPKLMPHLHLPLQSGSDSVLRRMSRRCFTKEFRELVQGLRERIPNLNITTDLIVGFPGESEEEFEDSLRFVEEMQFGHMHIFGFSAREGTRAAGLPGRVLGPVIKQRSRRMHQLAAQMKANSMAQYLGKTFPVLWEGNGTSNDSKELVFHGYTDNYLRVMRTVPAEASLQGTIAAVTLMSVNETGDCFVA